MIMEQTNRTEYNRHRGDNITNMRQQNCPTPTPIRWEATKPMISTRNTKVKGRGGQPPKTNGTEQLDGSTANNEQ